LRIGQGFDIHKFVEGRKLVLGGVEFDHPQGLAGHSDADVLTHAVIDALIGAAGLGDIGMHFPPGDPAYRDASSIGLLETICKAVGSLGYRIVNIDATVLAQAPRIGPHRGEMMGNLASATGLDPVRINVKAASPEGLGFLGRSEGIAALAVAMIEPVDDTDG
jgi:2-C-methyl-D-erythritol 2,4-cyclodiphosphate synthase